MVQCSLVSPNGVIKHCCAMADTVLLALVFLNARTQGPTTYRKVIDAANRASNCCPSTSNSHVLMSCARNSSDIGGKCYKLDGSISQKSPCGTITIADPVFLQLDGGLHKRVKASLSTQCKGKSQRLARMQFAI